MSGPYEDFVGRDVDYPADMNELIDELVDEMDDPNPDAPYDDDRDVCYGPGLMFDALADAARFEEVQF